MKRLRTPPPPSVPLTLQSTHVMLDEAERCRRAGKLGRAQSLCETLLGEYPEYVGALQTLGVVHLAKKNYRQALSCFIQAAVHCPKDWVNLSNLAGVYVKLGAFELAAQTIEEAERLKPDDPGIHWAFAEIHRERRDYAAAAERFARVLEISPDYADAAHGLGDCCAQLGQIDRAAAALRRAHELKPGSVAILYTLSQLPGLTEVDILGALGRVRRQEDQSRDDFETLLAFTRAAALDRAGRHTEAWANLIEANRREAPKHRESHRKQLLRMEAARKMAMEERGPPGARDAHPPTIPSSLFILGPSRSGKTTLERLVGMLDGVKRGFESRFVELAARRASQLSGLLTINNPLDLPISLDSRLREFYLEDIREFAQGARIVTDTHPAAISYVGRIAAALPSARFVFIRRGLDDAALRIFMKPYRAGNHYAYDLTTIREYLSWYYEMADIWLENLPATALTVAYEDMIADPRRTLAQVAAFCGATIPEEPLPAVLDDRGCAKPYRELMGSGKR